jgi:hypothetical protein
MTNQKDPLVQLSELMLTNGIPCTYEYPGYINVLYRGFDITIGEDGGFVSGNVHKDGKTYSFSPNLDMVVTDTVDLLLAVSIAWLAERYKHIDELLKPDLKTNVLNLESYEDIAQHLHRIVTELDEIVEYMYSYESHDDTERNERSDAVEFHGTKAKDALGELYGMLPEVTS